jgi:hypothetical protein
LDNILWLSGFDLVKRFDLKNRAISKAFCMECGCGLPYISGTGKALVVPAGSLNGEPNIDPQDNIFCCEKATWYDKGVIAPKFNRFAQ